MAEDSDGNRVPTFAIFVTIMFLVTVPFVTASGTGVTIESDSVNLTNFQTTNDSFFELEFNLSSIDDSGGSTYVGQVNFETTAIDGTVILNSSIPFSLAEGAQQLITYNITALSYGYTVITVGLSGDIGSQSQSDLVSFQRTIHRLKPLNISLASSSSIILESIDSNAVLTGNNTLSDGDYVQYQIPVINDGDYPWNGFVEITVDNGIVAESKFSTTFTVDGMNTEIIMFNSTIQVYEGTFTTLISLNGSDDEYIDDNEITFVTSVGPPELPVLDAQITYDEQNLTSGQTIVISVNNINNGTIDFNGVQTCLFNQEIVFQDPVNIPANSASLTEFNLTLKPGELQCTFSGQRIAESSVNNNSVTFALESALFEYAGSFAPSSTDGPWHVGDQSTYSLLVRNTGTKQGNVSLRMESSAGSYQGDFVSLGSDEAGEITITVPILVSGVEQFNWSLYTSDGDLSGDFEGQISVPVSPRQSYTMSIYDVMWSVTDGVTANWAVNLSEGISREVNIQIGYGSNSDDTIIYDVNMHIAQGSTGSQIQLGNVQGQYVVIRVQEVNWTASSSFSSFTKSIPQDRPDYNLMFNPQSTPNRPVAGESASVSVLLENNGEVAGATGTVILYDKDGVKLGESNTESIAASSTETVSFTFIWPTGDEVKLNVKWDYGTESKNIDKMFLSTIITKETDDSFSIPWTGLLGGLAVASMVILVSRMRSNSTGEKKPKASKAKSNKPIKKLSEVKIEFSCPECSRQLRVPENYQGSVKCPDCAHSFDVGAEAEDEIEEEEDVTEEVSDGKIEISCPDCSQSLRIPESYDGSVRCPSCKAIFKAKDG